MCRHENFAVENRQRAYRGVLTHITGAGRIVCAVVGSVVVKVAQLDRALDCGSKGRGFESRLSPLYRKCGTAALRQFLDKFLNFAFCTLIFELKWKG